MDLRFSEDQLMLKDMARKISLKEFGPRAAEVDEKEEFPWENKKVLEENGLLGV
jgi:alkylation response protein AidB-like acyl-CoA dehydrogenase